MIIILNKSPEKSDRLPGTDISVGDGHNSPDVRSGFKMNLHCSKGRRVGQEVRPHREVKAAAAQGCAAAVLISEEIYDGSV